MCSKLVERRGVGLNRWLYAVWQYCKYQNNPKVKHQNRAIMESVKYDELYKEIDRALPSIEYCLADKKTAQKEGAASLRGGVASEPSSRKGPTVLDRHAKALYEWLDTSKVSRIRMMMQWQASAGVSFVAGVHHRATQCFRMYGNTLHGDGSTNSVSLQEFQEAIKDRNKYCMTAPEGSVNNGNDDFA